MVAVVTALYLAGNNRSLAPFKPYIISKRTSYWSPDYGHKYGCIVEAVTVRGMKKDAFFNALNQQFSTSRGWSSPDQQVDEDAYWFLAAKGVTSPRLEMDLYPTIQIEGNSRVEIQPHVFKKVPFEQAETVMFLSRPITEFDALWLKLTNHGKIPYQEEGLVIPTEDEEP